jgi:hypothetical protein
MKAADPEARTGGDVEGAHALTGAGGNMENTHAGAVADGDTLRGARAAGVGGSGNYCQASDENQRQQTQANVPVDSVP